MTPKSTGDSITINYLPHIYGTTSGVNVHPKHLNVLPHLHFSDIFTKFTLITGTYQSQLMTHKPEEAININLLSD